MATTSARQQALYLLLLFGMLVLLVPRAGYASDVSCWVKWASYSLKHGLSNIYQLPDNNYNPLYHYVLWAFGRLLGSPARIEHFRHSLKAVTLLFDFAGAGWAASLVGERRDASAWRWRCS